MEASYHSGVRGLCKRFRRRRVLEQPDFTAEPGVVTALLGENGAGKPMLPRLGLGVVKDEAGTVVVNGFDPLRPPRLERQSIGYVSYKPNAYDWTNVRELFKFLRPQYPT